MNEELIFSNLLLKNTLADAKRNGFDIPKLTVYKYSGMSRGNYHCYQVYAGNKILGDYYGYYASEAKTHAVNEHYHFDEQELL